jgi:transcriptional regulator with XRE-family HTH domain
MPDGADEGTGARIAQYRKLRGFTQRGLALRANVAYGTLTKVESGHAVAQPTLVSAVARALRVDVGRLVPAGRPADDESSDVDASIEPLRLALDAYDLGPSEAVPPRPVALVEADVHARARQLMCDGQVAAVAAAMPALLDELAALVAADDADPRVWRAMAHGCRCAHHVASRSGYRDLAMIALDRMGWAAARSDEPLLGALREHERAHEYLRAGQHERGHLLQARAERLAADAPQGPGRAALAGTGHLAASVHAARDGDGDAAEAHLAEAEALATDVGEVDAAFWLSFGPTNVALHRVSALVAQERHGEAVDVAGDLRLPAAWHATRLGYHYMDLGRAHAALGEHDKALRCLVEARRIAPQQTRSHVTTRETVELLVLAKRNVSEGLARYARWVGV